MLCSKYVSILQVYFNWHLCLDKFNLTRRKSIVFSLENALVWFDKNILNCAKPIRIIFVVYVVIALVVVFVVIVVVFVLKVKI